MTLSQANNEYFDLGRYSRPVTTASEEAKLWFDRGLIWCYGFNHEEASVCFERATEIDPEFAMAWWGIAYANGPFYNKPWEFYGEQELPEVVALCYETTQKAIACSENASRVERALIQALSRRYQAVRTGSLEELATWQDDYAQGMREAYSSFPEDPDVVALCAEALITRTPWKLWDISSGKPAEGADTVEAKTLLEEGMRVIEAHELQPHPGILHMYIHAMEMSPYPERALRAADALRDLVPEAGHLQHMPTHIDVLCGHYYDAVVASDRAIRADERFLAYAGPFNFYTLARCHDYHLKMYAAMFLGQYKAALEAADGIVGTLPDEVLRVDRPHMASTLEGYYSMWMHVLVRFGKWLEIVDEPMPDDPELYPVTTGMYHYAKGVAQAALGNIDAAEEERRRFQEAYERVPASRRFFNNSARDVLSVGSEMLDGELEYRKENYELAFTHLRRAVELDDNLHYSEPWPWMHPPRHALGALLLEQDQVEEAEQIYRADLGLDNTLNRPAQHPENVWSLHGYVECLNRLGLTKEAEAMQFRLDLAVARTDVPIHASCACRLHQQCCD